MWVATEQLSLTAAVSFLDSELTEPYCGYVDPGNLQPVAVDPCPVFDEDTGLPTGDFQDPEAPKGQRLPVTPEFKGNLTARYEFPMGDYDAHLQGALVYVGERESDLRTIEREILGKLDAYTTVDLLAGFGTKDWGVELYVVNLFDELGEISRYSQCAEQVCGEQAYSSVTPPRTIGIRFNQDF